MTTSELQLLVSFAVHGADEKEAWLACSDPDHIEDEEAERADIQAVRGLFQRLYETTK